MKFEDRKKIKCREVETGDIILKGDNRYLIVFDGRFYGYVNLDTGLCSVGFYTLSDVMNQFDEQTRYIPNDDFRLILE